MRDSAFRGRVMALGISGATLADLMNIHFTSVSKMLNGKMDAAPLCILVATLEVLTSDQRVAWIERIDELLALSAECREK